MRKEDHARVGKAGGGVAGGVVGRVGVGDVAKEREFLVSLLESTCSSLGNLVVKQFLSCNGQN